MTQFPNSDFVHCHVHSEYSPFDGMLSVNKLVMKAREFGFPALALTDHGSMGGAIHFRNECIATKDKKGKDIPYPTIKPLIGCELYMSANHTNRGKDQQPRGAKGNHHIVLIAKNYEGYRNLSTLSHTSWTEGFYMSPRIDFDLLSKHSAGLICSSACLAGLVNANLLHGRYDEAKASAAVFKDIFGEDFFLEAMYHGIRLQSEILPSIIKIGSELDIPVICTNDVHYLDESHASSHEVFMCSKGQKCIHSPNRIKNPYPEFYLKSAQQMAEIFGEVPELLTNTLALADRVDSADIDKNLFGGMRLPIFEIPSGETPYSHLDKIARKGLKNLGWHTSQKHVDRLNLELEDVRIVWENNRYDFATYFLIVRDIIRHANEVGIITGPGRGSGYGSVLLRCIDVSFGPDPLEYGLLWERFLGFKDARFVKESDFGFEEKIEIVAEEDDRAVEHDPGGVDRY